MVAFRGTRDLDAGAWLTNFQTWQDDVAGGSCGERVHHGWGESWVQLRGRVRQGVEALLAEHPTYRLVVTGHSCGASLATLMAAEWAADGSLSALSPLPLLCSFASPRWETPPLLWRVSQPARFDPARAARRGLLDPPHQCGSTPARRSGSRPTREAPRRRCAQPDPAMTPCPATGSPSSTTPPLLWGELCGIELLSERGVCGIRWLTCALENPAGFF